MRGPPSRKVGEVVAQTRTSLPEIYAVARLSQEPVKTLMDEMAMWGLSEGAKPRKCHGPNIKNPVRAREKIKNDYRGGWVGGVRRGS